VVCEPKKIGKYFFWHLKGNDLLIKERTVWANLLISYVLQDFGISFILILNVNPFILSVIISFWFWFLGRLEITLIRLAECWVQIIPTWLQSFSMSHTYWILIFFGGMIMKKTEVVPIEHQRCTILRLEPYKSVRNNSKLNESFTRQSGAWRLSNSVEPTRHTWHKGSVKSDATRFNPPSVFRPRRSSIQYG